MAGHRDFVTQLESFDNEARNAARFAYADFAIQHAASKSKCLLNRLNNTPTFWLTAGAAFQTAAYISLGRIFDNKSRFNIHELLNAAERNIPIFQREALAERKREGKTVDPPWLADYLANAYYPKQATFARLRKMVDKYHALYSKAIRPARNKYIAHRVRHGHEQVSALFAHGHIKDLWRLTVFLQQLHEALWNLLHNGRKPTFRPMRYSVASMFKRVPTGNSAHESIVREIQNLMLFIESATPNLTLHTDARGNAVPSQRSCARTGGRRL